MSHQYEEIKNRALQMKKIIEGIQQNESIDLSWNDKLNNQLKLLYNRIHDIDSNAFIVIVVGPVKSGKSTFVNLLAHSKVSPTSYIECTVKPSIISRKKDEDKGCWITTYALRGNDENESGGPDCVDLVIDAIKELPGASLDNIESTKYELNEENLRNQVELDLDRIASYEKTLLTSITAEGGAFLDKDIYLVDMPGFDGAEANLESSYYRTITSRADLVIFIQSSNSAITKISGEFFKMLREDNRTVPVYLVHNFFDSSYWRIKETQKKKIEEQMQAAKAKIRYHGFNLSDDKCISINLGKIEDSYHIDDEQSVVDAAYKDELKDCVQQFKEVEEDLHKHLLTSQQTTHLRTCMGRTVIVRNKFLKLIDDEQDAFRKKIENWEFGLNLFTDLQKNLHMTFNVEDFPFNLDYGAIISKINDSAATFKTFNIVGKYGGNNARNTIKTFVQQLTDMISASIIKSFGDPEESVTIKNLTISCFNEIRNAVHQIDPQYAGDMVQISEFENIEPDNMDLSVIQNQCNIDQRISNPGFLGFGHYSPSEMCNFIDDIVTCIVGKKEYAAPHNIINGILQNEVERIAKDCYHKRMKAVIEKRHEKFIEYIRRIEEELLVPVTEKDIERNKQLTSLKEKLNNPVLDEIKQEDEQ